MFPLESLECLHFFAYITYLLAYLIMLSTTLLNISTILILNFLLINPCQIWAWFYACLRVLSLFSLLFFLTCLPMLKNTYWKNVVQTKVTMLDYFNVWQLVCVSSTSCGSSHLLRSLILSHNSAPPQTGFLWVVALVVLELTLETRLTLNSDIYLPLPPEGWD